MYENIKNLKLRKTKRESSRMLRVIVEPFTKKSIELDKIIGYLQSIWCYRIKTFDMFNG